MAAHGPPRSRSPTRPNEAAANFDAKNAAMIYVSGRTSTGRPRAAGTGDPAPMGQVRAWQCYDGIRVTPAPARIIPKGVTASLRDGVAGMIRSGARRHCVLLDVPDHGDSDC